jgi:hypothetical protein
MRIRTTFPVPHSLHDEIYRQVLAEALELQRVTAVEKLATEKLRRRQAKEEVPT